MKTREVGEKFVLRTWAECLLNQKRRCSPWRDRWNLLRAKLRAENRRFLWAQKFWVLFFEKKKTKKKIFFSLRSAKEILYVKIGLERAASCRGAARRSISTFGIFKQKSFLFIEKNIFFQLFDFLVDRKFFVSFFLRWKRENFPLTKEFFEPISTNSQTKIPKTVENRWNSREKSFRFFCRRNFCRFSSPWTCRRFWTSISSREPSMKRRHCSSTSFNCWSVNGSYEAPVRFNNLSCKANSSLSCLFSRL